MAINRAKPSPVEQIELDLTADLKSMEADALARYKKFKHKQKGDNLTASETSIHSFHATIGGKNDKYTDLIRTQFSSPEDFIARWLRGLRNSCEEIDKDQNARHGRAYRTSQSHRLVELLRDEVILKYTMTFLTRNFYRNLKARTRAKPSESLWTLWIGKNEMMWGLLLTPAYRRNQWVNDKSEIRRADYVYWTIGHLLATGLVDPEYEEPVRFNSLDDIITFYKTTLKRQSSSIYEKQFFNLYCEYLKSSSDPFNEPILIPELRYGGLEKKHQYRLDFCILNAHVMKFTGFEISPASTHMAVSKIKDKKQYEVNEELSKEWAGEMNKRNDYLSEYNISVLTFTDEDLKDVPACFESVVESLSERELAKPNLNNELEQLKNIAIN